MTFVLGDDRDNDYSIPFSLNSRVTKNQSLKLVVKHTLIYMYTYYTKSIVGIDLANALVY